MGVGEIVAVALGSGSVLYLIIEKLFEVKTGKAKASTQAIEVENATSIVDLYKQIDTIVGEKTEKMEKKQDRLEQKIDLLSGEVESLKTFKCVKTGCPDRVKFDKNNVI